MTKCDCGAVYEGKWADIHSKACAIFKTDVPRKKNIAEEIDEVMANYAVKIRSHTPVYFECDADTFGEHFANMPDQDQVEVFRAMVKHMHPHRTQWDYIAMELEKPENADVLHALRQVLFPNGVEP